MSTAVAYVLAFFDKDREPLRRKLYAGVLLPVLSVAVGVGLLTGDDAASIAGAAGSLLLIPVTEIARQQVTPLRPAEHRAKR